jgi:excisionase family DNA binding protein
LDKQYYTVREAAEILGLREQTVRVYLNTNRMAYEKILNSTAITKEELNRQLKKRGKKEIE